MDVSESLIHRQLTVHGSWVDLDGADRRDATTSSTLGTAPETVVTDTFTLTEADRAYHVADAGQGDKVGMVWPAN